MLRDQAFTEPRGCVHRMDGLRAGTEGLSGCMDVVEQWEDVVHQPGISCSRFLFSCVLANRAASQPERLSDFASCSLTSLPLLATPSPSDCLTTFRLYHTLRLSFSSTLQPAQDACVRCRPFVRGLCRRPVVHDTTRREAFRVLSPRKPSCAHTEPKLTRKRYSLTRPTKDREREVPRAATIGGSRSWPHTHLHTSPQQQSVPLQPMD